MTQVNIHYAKTHLSALLAQVAAGEEIIIAKNGTPLAKLSSAQVKKPRVPGRIQFKAAIPSFDPMTGDELREVYEGHPGDPLRMDLPKTKKKKKA